MELPNMISKIGDFAKKLVDESDLDKVLLELKEVDKVTERIFDGDIKKKYPEKVEKANSLLNILTKDVKGRVYKGNLSDHIYEYQQWLKFTYKNIFGQHFGDPKAQAFIKSKLGGKGLYEEGYKAASAHRKQNEGLGGTPLRMYH